MIPRIVYIPDKNEVWGYFHKGKYRNSEEEPTVAIHGIKHCPHTQEEVWVIDKYEEDGEMFEEEFLGYSVPINMTKAIKFKDKGDYDYWIRQLEYYKVGL